MSNLIFIVSSLILLLGFLLLVYVEARTGKRLLSGIRTALDKKVARASFIRRHIDWAGFTAHVFTQSLERVAHDVIHSILLLVRTIERLLTSIIRTLRERVARRSSRVPSYSRSSC